MIKKCLFYTSLIIIVAYLSFAFKPFELKSQDWFYVKTTEESLYNFPSKEQQDYTHLNIPFTGKFFIGFKEALAFKESQGKYKKINSLGYMGKYQFGAQTLKTIGVHDSTAFLNSPKMQEKAFVALLSKNKYELREEISKYSGKVIHGIKVTESGILAAAHLGGVGSVKRFFKSDGSRYFKDKYGTSIRSYMKNFGGYETSGIEANRSAKVIL